MLEAFFRIFEALEQSGIGLTVRNAYTLYPLANIGHVLAIAIFFALVATMDIAVLRRNLAEARETLVRTRGWAMLAFVAVLGTGLVMFVAEAGMLVKNASFQTKMAAIGVSGLNLWLFGVFERRGWFWSMRISALLSLLLWLLAIAAGRGIAYL